MKENYILGRGEIHVDGRYIGNSPSFHFLPSKPDKIIRIGFATDVISEENLTLYFKAQSGELPVSIVYKADNPIGRNINFIFPNVKLGAGKYEFKGDTWQKINFIGEVHLDGDRFFDFTMPVTHQFKG